MARNTRLVPSSGSSPWPSPATSTPGSASVSIVNSLPTSRATARQSKPGPRLATVAGARTVRCTLASQAEGGRDGVGVDRQTGRCSGPRDGPVWLLEAVAGEHTDDGGTVVQAAFRHQPEQPGDGCR